MKHFKGPNGFIFGVESAEQEKLARKNGCTEVPGPEGDTSGAQEAAGQQASGPAKLPLALANTNLKDGFPGKDAFVSAGLKNYRSVHQATDEQLLSIPGVSQETVTEARAAIALLVGQGSN